MPTYLTHTTGTVRGFKGGPRGWGPKNIFRILRKSETMSWLRMAVLVVEVSFQVVSACEAALCAIDCA
jgi:hypothetical protein